MLKKPACVRSPDIGYIQLSHQSIEPFAFLVSLLPHLLSHSEPPKSENVCVSLSAEKKNMRDGQRTIS